MINKSKNIPFLLVLLISFYHTASAQKKQKIFTDKDLFETEVAFSSDSKELGFITANLKYAALDAVVFRPVLINAIEWSNKLKTQDSTYQITWYPSLVDMSMSGDLGYATGPFDNISKTPGDTSENHGQFLTVWKKQKDGRLQFILDFGSNVLPLSEFVKKEPVYQPGSKAQKNYTIIDTAKGLANIMLLEKQFSDECKLEGDVKAYKKFAASDTRFFYQRKFYAKGLDSLISKLGEPKGWHTWNPMSGTISQSGELAIVYGRHTITDENKINNGYYLHIWKKQANGQWVIMAQVTNLVK
ncbi:MAG: nuclear transport factor 2 family protein [Ginsengibacter sp.]